MVGDNKSQFFLDTFDVRNKCYQVMYAFSFTKIIFRSYRPTAGHEIDGMPIVGLGPSLGPP